jgi:hypothetical protein
LVVFRGSRCIGICGWSFCFWQDDDLGTTIFTCGSLSLFFHGGFFLLLFQRILRFEALFGDGVALDAGIGNFG